MKSFIRKLIPDFVLLFYHWFLAVLANIFYGAPSKKLKVIGVTGTNGKSTVVAFLSAILEEAGYRVGSVSSLRFKIGEKEWQNKLKMTMPGRFHLQGFLKKCLKENCDYVVLEVTSEGIKQYRHKGVKFKGAIFTNLSKEHIESHGTLPKYRETKEKLFADLKGREDTFVVINREDPSAKFFARYPAGRKILYSVSDAKPRTFNWGSEFWMKGQRFVIHIPGKFNAANALAAIMAGAAERITLEVAARALSKIKGVPGRLEKVSDNPTAIVDYAHTPDALNKVYKTIKNHFSEKPLICVLGAAGGGRDKWKRPELGRIAAEYCKEVILTNEDPYDENPETILEEIASGLSLNSEFQISNSKKIIDRRRAINEGLNEAKDRDGILVITGKGAEPWIMGTGGRKISWDDRRTVREELKKT